MIVRWYPDATAEMLKIAAYIQDNFGDKCSKDFLWEVEHTEHLLCFSPEMGKKELLLDASPLTYRSIVVARLNKIIYRIDGDIIYIVAFWPCRRDPKVLVAQVEG